MLLVLVFFFLGLCTCDFPFVCDDEWIRHDFKCYRLYEHFLTFPEAIDFCAKSYNGQLATITSKEEQDFIRDHVYTEGLAWIGGVRLSLSNKDTNFYWINGNKFNYTFWMPGEPDNQDNEENCVGIGPGGGGLARWYDYRCDETIGVLCQRNLNSSDIDQVNKYIAIMAEEEKTMSETIDSFRAEELKTKTKLGITYVISISFVILIGIAFYGGKYGRVKRFVTKIL